jgi:hypothetical protein
MRTWLLSLLLVGLMTAGGFQWWRANQLRANRIVEIASVAPDVGAEDGAPVEVDDGVAVAGEDEGENLVNAPETLVSLTNSNPGSSVQNGAGAPAAAPVAASDVTLVNAASPPLEVERETPGGAASETDAEAKRKAVGLLEQAAKVGTPLEQSILLTQALRSGVLDRATDEKAYADLLEANKRGLLNPRSLDSFMKMEVRKGDSLWLICKRIEKEHQLRVEPGLIRLVNSMASNAIYPGANLKVPAQPLSIYVKKSRFRLEVMLGNVLIRRYAVGTGKDNRTPEGKFTIATRLKDPHWYKPGVGKLSPDHPENILGTRWLGFAAKDGFPDAATFGVHGTKEDQTIGTESSAGCIRMHNADVEELFEWIAEGTTVEIVP